MSKHGRLEQKENRSQEDILLTHDQVKKLKLKKIFEWPSDLDVFSLKYGTSILIGASMLSGVIIWSRHRKLFKLEPSYGFVSSLFVSVVLPSTVSAFAIEKNFTENLYIMSKNNINQCLLCKEINAIGLFVSIGALLPTVSSWMVSYIFAHRFKTFGIPTYRFKDLSTSASRKFIYKDINRILLMTNKGIPTLLTKVVATQIIFASLFLYIQQKQYFEIEDKFIYTSKELESIISQDNTEEFLSKKTSIFQKFGDNIVQTISNLFKRD